MSYTDGALQQDVNGARAIGVYSPSLGTVSAQAGAVSSDGSGNYAPMVTQARISDANGNAYGTFSNPIATNQLVGTPIYQTTTLAAATGGNVTLPGTTGKTTYINGFYVAIGHSSAGTPAGQVTVSLDGGTTTHMNFLIACSTSYPGLVEVNFPDPIPATLTNTGIRITAPTLASAGIGSISAFGYQL